MHIMAVDDISIQWTWLLFD